MSAATSIRSSATSSRNRSASSASSAAPASRTRPRRRPRTACSTCWSARTPPKPPARRSAQRFRDGHLGDREIEIEVEDTPQLPFDIPGQPQMINLGEMLGKAMGNTRTKRRKMSVDAAWGVLLAEESDKRLDNDDINRAAVASAEANGIVFLDEIDKIAVSDVRGGSVSREGVQRDLLPLIEGTTVATKYGPVKTDHILFIASAARSTSRSPATCCPSCRAGCRSASS